MLALKKRQKLCFLPCLKSNFDNSKHEIKEKTFEIEDILTSEISVTCQAVKAVAPLLETGPWSCCENEFRKWCKSHRALKVYLENKIIEKGKSTHWRVVVLADPEGFDLREK